MFYLDLFRTLNEEQIRYLVVGGVAINLHGVVRLTLDVDIATDPGIDQCAQWERACERMKLMPMRPVTFRQMYDPKERRRLREEKNLIAFGLRRDNVEDPVVDILFDIPKTFSEAYDRRVVKVVEGIAVPLASVADLLAMKADAGRAKDIADMQELRKLPM
jgi:hypothetical protein